MQRNPRLGPAHAASSEPPDFLLLWLTKFPFYSSTPTPPPHTPSLKFLFTPRCPASDQATLSRLTRPTHRAPSPTSPTMATPRVFIVRHGETEWSLSGAHTGKTDIPLTPHGESRIRATARALVGPDRLIQPPALAAVLTSPRRRARRTLGLLFADPTAPPGAADAPDPAVDGPDGHAALSALRARGCIVQVREEAQEWDYGAYEGLRTAEITAQRAAEGRGKWEIWSEGAPGGEGPEEVTARLDGLIAAIRGMQGAAFAWLAGAREGACPPGDVVVVAHGHILRCLAARWVGRSVTENPHFILEAGGVGVLSYEHGRVEEPALVLGGAFVG